MINATLEKLGNRAKAITAILILVGMVTSGVSYGAAIYIDKRVEAIVVAALDEFRQEYQCDKLRTEIARVAQQPDTLTARAELARLNRLYAQRGCARFEVF